MNDVLDYGFALVSRRWMCGHVEGSKHCRAYVLAAIRQIDVTKGRRPGRVVAFVSDRKGDQHLSIQRGRMPDGRRVVGG